MNLVNLTKDFISVQSVFPKEEGFALFIKKWLEKNTDCKIEVQPVDKGRNNLLITRGKGKRSILLSGHLDTVSVVDGWKTDPFKAEVSGNKLFGLGAWDMKSGLAVILNLITNFESKNYTLKVSLSVDEENYSVGAHRVIDSGFCKDVDFVMIPEPGFVHGENGISIGRSGRATYIVEIKGISAHGSYPEEGINAIEEASIFINLIKGIKLSGNKELGSSVIYPRLISSEAKGFSVPDVCFLEIDSRLVYPDKPIDILNKLKKVSKDFYKNKKIKFMPKIYYKERPTPFCSPYQIDKNNKFVKICEQTVKEVTGKSVLFYRNSVADECIFAERLGVPVVTIGPAGGNAHKANEYVDIKSLEKTYYSYLKILRKFDSLYD